MKSEVNLGGDFLLPRIRFWGRAADHGLTCVSKADDLIFLSLVMLQQGFPSRPTEALQRRLESPSGHRPIECGSLVEVKLVQDAFLGKIEKQLPLALQVKGGTPTCRTWTISFEVHYFGWRQEQKSQEQGGGHCWRMVSLKDTKPVLRVSTGVASTLSWPPGTLGGVCLRLA